MRLARMHLSGEPQNGQHEAVEEQRDRRGERPLDEGEVQMDVALLPWHASYRKYARQRAREALARTGCNTVVAAIRVQCNSVGAAARAISGELGVQGGT